MEETEKALVFEKQRLYDSGLRALKILQSTSKMEQKDITKLYILF